MKPDDYLLIKNQLCFPLYTAARKVVSAYTPYLQPLNLTYTQYITMLVLWEKKELTVGELCKTLYLDNGTITPLLKKLQSYGYIQKKRDEKDERIVHISLTDEGAALKEKAVEIPSQLSNCLSLTQEESISLYNLLYKIIDKI